MGAIPGSKNWVFSPRLRIFANILVEKPGFWVFRTKLPRKGV
jgi:hypothetical protein